MHYWQIFTLAPRPGIARAAPLARTASPFVKIIETLIEHLVLDAHQMDIGIAAARGLPRIK